MRREYLREVRVFCGNPDTCFAQSGLKVGLMFPEIECGTS